MKVYILMIEDVSDGVAYTHNIDVYSDFNIVKERFDELVKSYKEKRDFKDYVISESSVHFYATLNNLSDYLYIDILEKPVLDTKY